MPQQVQDLKRAKQLVKELLSLTDEAIHQCQGARSWGFLDILCGSTLSTLVKHVKISSTKNVLDDINYKMRELKQCININNMPEGFKFVKNTFVRYNCRLAPHMKNYIGESKFICYQILEEIIYDACKSSILEPYVEVSNEDLVDIEPDKIHNW